MKDFSMYRSLAALVFFLIAALASPVKAEIIDGSRILVIDGDTVALPCAAPSPGCSEKIRFYAIDAPEMSKPRCEGEYVLALQAKEGLRTLLTGPVAIVRGEPGAHRATDPYGRTLGTLVRIDDTPDAPRGDVQRVLLDRGLALPYAAGAPAKERRRAYWCG